MNRFWCLLVKQEYGYIRGPNGLEGNLLDAASEIGNFRAFLNGRYAAVSGVIGKLQKDGIMTDSYQLGSSLKSGLIQVATQKDGFSDILSLSEDISRTLIKTIQGE